jgi:predicted metal-binding protein
MKIAIIVRKETLNTCTAKGCLNAFAKKIDSFERYNQDVELVGFTFESGDMEYKIEKLKNNGVEIVHLSSCMRAKSSEYEALAERLSENFHVIGYTHGSEHGKTKNAINLKMKEKL